MTHAADPVWDELGALWRDQQAPPQLHDTLVRRVRRDSLRLRLTTIVEIAMLVALLVVSVAMFPRGASPMAAAGVAALWFVNAGLLGFATWNRRGSWAAEREAPDAYIALMIRRAHSRRRTARFVRVAVFAQAFVVVGFVRFVLRGGDAASQASVANAIVLAGLAVVGFVTWSYWYEARARADLADLDAMARLLGD